MADTEKLRSLQLGDPREALAEFELPFGMDMVEARDADPEFLAGLNEPVTIELRLSNDIT